MCLTSTSSVDVAAALADLHDDVGAAGQDAGPVALVAEQGDRLGDGLRGGVVDVFQRGLPRQAGGSGGGDRPWVRTLQVMCFIGTDGHGDRENRDAMPTFPASLRGGELFQLDQHHAVADLQPPLDHADAGANQYISAIRALPMRKSGQVAVTALYLPAGTATSSCRR